jgi:hypothetical protein
MYTEISDDFPRSLSVVSKEPADESRINYTSNYHNNAMNTNTNNTNSYNINSSSNINTLSAVQKQRTYLSLKGRLEEMNMSQRHVKSVFREVVLLLVLARAFTQQIRSVSQCKCVCVCVCVWIRILCMYSLACLCMHVVYAFSIVHTHT